MLRVFEKVAFSGLPRKWGISGRDILQKFRGTTVDDASSIVSELDRRKEKMTQLNTQLNNDVHRDVFQIEFGYVSTRREYLLVEGEWRWAEITGIFSNGDLSEFEYATHYRLFRKGETGAVEWIELTDSARSELKTILAAGFSPVSTKTKRNKWVKTALLLNK
jgi:hypothetical protein